MAAGKKSSARKKASAGKKSPARKKASADDKGVEETTTRSSSKKKSSKSDEGEAFTEVDCQSLAEDIVEKRDEGRHYGTGHIRVGRRSGDKRRIKKHCDDKGVEETKKMLDQEEEKAASSAVKTKTTSAASDRKNVSKKEKCETLAETIVHKKDAINRYGAERERGRKRDEKRITGICLNDENGVEKLEKMLEELNRDIETHQMAKIASASAKATTGRQPTEQECKVSEILTGLKNATRKERTKEIYELMQGCLCLEIDDTEDVPEEMLKDAGKALSQWLPDDGGGAEDGGKICHDKKQSETQGIR